MVDLTGLIDPHVHASPEHIPRLLDDIELVRQGAAAKLGGILIKSHTTLTADRAVIAVKVVPGIQVWGGLVLNKSVGGFNPVAVETTIAYGAVEIWMPTLDAANHRTFYRQRGQGLSINNHRVSKSVVEILELIAKNDVTLGTGHLSVAEIRTLAREAHQRGVRKVLITHPEAPFIDMPIGVQRELAKSGCLFERTWVFTTPALGRKLAPERIIHDIREVGFESTVLATDMGQVGNPTPIEGLRAFVRACQDAGFEQSEIQRMGAKNIGEWFSGSTHFLKHE
jgi:hypothetical protein